MGNAHLGSIGIYSIMLGTSAERALVVAFVAFGAIVYLLAAILEEIKKSRRELLRLGEQMERVAKDLDSMVNYLDRSFKQLNPPKYD